MIPLQLRSCNQAAGSFALHGRPRHEAFIPLRPPDAAKGSRICRARFLQSTSQSLRDSPTQRITLDTNPAKCCVACHFLSLLRRRLHRVAICSPVCPDTLSPTATSHATQTSGIITPSCACISGPRGATQRNPEAAVSPLVLFSGTNQRRQTYLQKHLHDLCRPATHCSIFTLMMQGPQPSSDGANKISTSVALQLFSRTSAADASFWTPGLHQATPAHRPVLLFHGKVPRSDVLHTCFAAASVSAALSQQAIKHQLFLVFYVC